LTRVSYCSIKVVQISFKSSTYALFFKIKKSAFSILQQKGTPQYKTPTALKTDVFKAVVCKILSCFQLDEAKGIKGAIFN
jgi:hypothetical protein